MTETLFISPHNDDEALFGGIILQRVKPLVLIVTDSYIQLNRGDNVKPEQRWEETTRACEVLGVPVMRLGIRDDVLDDWAIHDRLQRFSGFKNVYIPAVMGGNPAHDLIGQVTLEIFPNAIQYATYKAGEWKSEGAKKIIPTPEEAELKRKALQCYTSQINLPSTKPHFEAVEKDLSEWVM